MNTKLLAALALSLALPVGALAQNGVPAGTAQGSQNTNQNNARGGLPDSPRQPAQTGGSHNGSTMAGPFVTIPEHGAWRVSDLEGKSVYTDGGENIGSISDVLVSQDGSVNAIIIGVGGFLGINEKDVAVDFSALRFGPGMTQGEADQSAEQNRPSNETTASTTAGQNTRPPAAGGNPAGAARTPDTGSGDAASSGNGHNNATHMGEDGLPERIVLNVTREQLEDAPAFQGMTPAR